MPIWSHYLDAMLSELLRDNLMLDVSRNQNIVLASILKWYSLSTHYRSLNPCANTLLYERCFKIRPSGGCGSYSLIHVPKIAVFAKLEAADVLIRVAHLFHILLRVDKFEMTDQCSWMRKVVVYATFYANSNSKSVSLPTPYKLLKALC